MGYIHMNYEERVILGRLWEDGETVREISRQLGRAASTVSRELRRLKKQNRDYHPWYADRHAKKRRRESYRKPRLKSKAMQNYVKRKILLGWSPEQITGRLRREKAPEVVSHEAIYQYIYDCEPELAKRLCRHHATRKKFRQSKKTKKSAIPQRISISERPAEIQERAAIGHWECDLMTSKKSTVSLQVCVERKTRYVELRLIPNRSAKVVSSAIIDALKKHERVTITYDNGAENASHRTVNKSLNTTSYFYDSYHPWQKGTVENTIGLIRRRICKNSDISPVSLEELKLLQRNLNSRPRKCLQYATPMEVLKLQSVALQT